MYMSTKPQPASQYVNLLLSPGWPPVCLDTSAEGDNPTDDQRLTFFEK